MKEASSMTISKNPEGTVMTAFLQGRLDTLTAPDMEKKLRDSLKGVTDLTLDFTALEYISSAGLRMVLTAQKLMNGHGVMKLSHVNGLIMEIFDATGLADILTFE